MPTLKFSAVRVTVQAELSLQMFLLFEQLTPLPVQSGQSMFSHLIVATVHIAFEKLGADEQVTLDGEAAFFGPPRPTAC